MIKIFVSTIVHVHCDNLADIETSISSSYNYAKSLLLEKREAWINDRAEIVMVEKEYTDIKDAIDLIITEYELNNCDDCKTSYYSHFVDHESFETIFKLECLTYQEKEEE